MFAVINLYKPTGATSHDMVSKLRKRFNLKRVGHLGTLDPQAEGVLPLCLGNATRLIEYFPEDKAYEAEIILGQTTFTLDADSPVESETPAPHLTLANVEAALPAFLGTIEQRVPRHASVHYKGKKLYHYAHQGIVIPEEDLPVRETTIYLLQCQSFTPGEFPRLTLQVACSSGTYVRALARDIGAALGCGAHLAKLIRTGHGQFRSTTAVTLDELLSCDDPHIHLQNPLDFMPMPTLELPHTTVFQALCNGMKIPLPPTETRLKGNDLALACYEGYFAGVVQRDGPHLKPLKIIQQNMAEAFKPNPPKVVAV